MKKAVLFALLFAVAGVAQAYYEPIPNVYYYCNYGVPLPPSTDPGFSLFSINRSIDPGGVLPWWRGIEYFDASVGGTFYTDNRKVTFAKPVNMTFPALGGRWGTRWEFTINPGGPQCKNTDIVYDSYGTQEIHFRNCTDGHTRVCYY